MPQRPECGPRGEDSARKGLRDSLDQFRTGESTSTAHRGKVPGDSRDDAEDHPVVARTGDSHGADDNPRRVTGALAAALALAVAGCLSRPAPKISGSPRDPTQASASRAESLAEAFINVYNLNEPRTLTDFIRTTYAESLVSTEDELRAQRDRWLRAYSLIGPVELRHVEADGSRRINVWTYGLLTRTWLAFTLEAMPDRSRAITDLTIFATSRPAALDPGPRMSLDELPAYLESYLDGLASVDAFSGVALLVRGGKVRWSFAAGYPRDDAQRPIDRNTAFDLASVSKMFAAVAALKRREAGRIDFDAPVSHYLTDFPAHIGDKITLAQLLSHRTGIRLQEDEGLYERLFDARSFDEQFALETEALARSYGEDFEPVDRYVYSNEGIDIVARVLEAETGHSYYDVVGEEIFEPLGMHATRAYDSEVDAADLAVGRTRQHPPDARFIPGPRRSNLYFVYASGRPAGGFVTTGEDMAAFAIGLMSGKLLPDESLRDMTARLAFQSETIDYKLYYGLGSDVYVYETGIVFGHGGGRPGASTRLDIFPDYDVALIVLSNYDYIAHRIGEHVQEILMVGTY